jgi:hypothetical protein
LNLVIDIPNKKKIDNYGSLDEKEKAAKAKKDQREKELEKNLDDDLDFDLNPYTTHMAKKCLDKDYMLNFMKKSRREKLIQLYSVDPSVLPASEVKPLKVSSKGKFANTMEINFEMVVNAQAKGIEALESGDGELGHWNLVNFMEFIFFSEFREIKN